MSTMTSDFRRIRNLSSGIFKSFLFWFLDISNTTKNKNSQSTVTKPKHEIANRDKHPIIHRKSPTASSKSWETISLSEKIDDLKRQLALLEVSIKQGFPDAYRHHLKNDENFSYEVPFIQLFTPAPSISIPTMHLLLEERDENLQKQKVIAFEEYIKDLLRRFNILVSIKDVLNYGPAHLAYAELDRAKECLHLAEDVLMEIRKLESHPTFNKISESTKDDTDVIHFLIEDLKQAINQVCPPPPKQKLSFAQVQQQLTNQYNAFHSESKNILLLLKKRRIRYLYHLTDRRNINDIKYHQGIYARSILAELDIASEYPGTTFLSKNIDSDRHTEKYVHLYLTENQQAIEEMKNRGLDPVALRINPQVAALRTTKLASSHLGKADVEITDQTMSYLEFLDKCTTAESAITFWKTNPIESEAIVLVENGIPKEYIQNLDDFA